MTKMKSHVAALLTAAAFALTACQQNGYHIKGTAEGLNDGDTLILSNDLNEGTPTDTLIVSNGEFSLKGETDTVTMNLLYVLNRPDIYVTFFLEPGTIDVHLAQDTESSQIGGTRNNENWQKLNNMFREYGHKLQQLSGKFYDDSLSDAEQDVLVAQIDSIRKELNTKTIEAAAENIDTELGFFILTNFDDRDVLTPDKWRELTKRMPEKFRNRQAFKDIDAQMQSQQAQQPNPFVVSQPDGEPFDIMAEVKRHQITLLDFWASWCGPCRQEMPFMKSLYERYKDKGLGIVGISLDNDHTAWTEGISQLGITWPQVSELRGWEASLARHFQVNSIPHIVIMDAEGKVLSQGLRGPQLETFVSERLK